MGRITATYYVMEIGSKGVGVQPPPSPARADFSIMMGMYARNRHSVCTPWGGSEKPHNACDCHHGQCSHSCDQKPINPPYGERWASLATPIAPFSLIPPLHLCICWECLRCISSLMAGLSLVHFTRKVVNGVDRMDRTVKQVSK